MRTEEAIRFRIMDICRQEHLTLNGLCTKCGITQSTLKNTICGKNNSATVATIKKICDGWDGNFRNILIARLSATWSRKSASRFAAIIHRKFTAK